MNGTLHVERSRFIPACAGNASADHRRKGAATVHPRVCGERLAPVAAIGGPAGSSPRVRGTLGLARASLEGVRFIPACAGNARPKAR